MDKLLIDEERIEDIVVLRVQGLVDSGTSQQMEERLDQLVGEGVVKIIVDLGKVDYISSAGLRVIFKAAKHTAGEGRRLAAANRKPHIDKVFEILKALPDMAVFANDQELDDYLDTMQRRARGA